LLISILAGIPEENRILHQPTLLFQGKNFITATADFPGQMKTSVPNLRVKTLDADHWIMLERAEETNAAIEEFLKE
jgi:pimeloyl-ACP methyl ester carboxylesterase